MHLFIIHQFPDFDSLAPVIYKINSINPGHAIILSVYPVFDFKKFKLMKFLIKHNTRYLDLSEVNFKNKILKILLKLINILPNHLLRKLNFFYRFLYYKVNLYSEKDIINFIKKNNIQSITLDDQASIKQKKIMRNSTFKTKIEFYIFKIGIEMRKDILIDENNIKYSDMLILGDRKIKVPESLRSKNIKRFNSPRFSTEWLEILESINEYKLENYTAYNKNRKLRILILPRPLFKSSVYLDIYNNLIKKNNLEIKFLNKPRGDLRPIEINEGFKDLGTSNHINWADIIISQSTSVLFEAIIKKKNIFFLNYLVNNHKYLKDYDYSKEKYYIEDANFVKKINSLNHLISEIDLIVNDGKLNELDKNSEIYIKEYIGDNYDKINTSEKYFINV
jgi:hypothetical protein